MAPRKCAWAAVFIWIFVSLILTCKCDDVKNSNESDRGDEVDQHVEESSNEEVQAEHETDAAFKGTDAESGMNDNKSFTTKDHFQEELVIRPLHSGDIYASFQFRTQLETDFLQGKKGL